jgi:hypothetical protein
VDHVVPDLQVPEIGKETTQLAGAPELGPRGLVEEVPAGKNDSTEIREKKSMREVSEVQLDAPGGRLVLGRERRGDLGLPQNLDETVREPTMADEDVHLAVRAALCPDLVKKILESPTKGR